MKKIIIIAMCFIFLCGFYGPRNGSITISASGPTDNVSGPDLKATSCTFQSSSANSSPIYFGNSTVTNASGVNQGMTLSIGQSLSDVSLTNANQIYFAADTSTPGQIIYYFCI